MKRAIKELDLVELTEDLPSGLIEGARGVVVGIQTDICTVEFLDGDGLTIGLFDIPMDKLELADPAPFGVSLAREE
ncbi:MAG: DUF4926 domain-containing protein [Coriobacteriia bacterium]